MAETEEFGGLEKKRKQNHPSFSNSTRKRPWTVRLSHQACARNLRACGLGLLEIVAVSVFSVAEMMPKLASWAACNHRGARQRVRVSSFGNLG